MLTFLIVKKSIPKTTFDLALAHRKLSSKNLILPYEKNKDYYFVNFQSNAINFLSFNISFSHYKFYLKSESLVHCVNFVF